MYAFAILVVLLAASGYLLSVKIQPMESSSSLTTSVASHLRNAPDKTPVVIPANTEIEVRTLDTLSTKSSRVGDHFLASIERSILVNGVEAVPRGAMATGVVTAVKESGRVKGRSYLSLRLQSIELKDGKRISVTSHSVSRLGKSNTNRNFALLGGGAGIGAGIGAIAAGGKGVAIGGPVGFGAGLATRALLRGHEVTIPSETLLRFRLAEPVPVATL